MEAGSNATPDVVMDTVDLQELAKNLANLPREIIEIICLNVAQNDLQLALSICFARLGQPLQCLQPWNDKLEVLKFPHRKGYQIIIDRYEDNPFPEEEAETIRIEGRDNQGNLAYRALIKDHPTPYTIDLQLLSDNRIPEGVALHSVHSVTLLDGETGSGVYYRACGSRRLKELTFLNAGSSTLRYMSDCRLVVTTVFFFVNEDAAKKRNRFTKVVSDHLKSIPTWLEIGLSPLSKTIKKIYFVTVKPHEDEDEEQIWIDRQRQKQLHGSGRWHSWSAMAAYYTFHCPKWYDNFDRVEFAKAQIKVYED